MVVLLLRCSSSNGITDLLEDGISNLAVRMHASKRLPYVNRKIDRDPDRDARRDGCSVSGSLDGLLVHAESTSDDVIRLEAQRLICPVDADPWYRSPVRRSKLSPSKAGALHRHRTALEETSVLLVAQGEVHD